MAKIDHRGWWQNGKGEFVHPECIKITDTLKDELVEEILAKASMLNKTIALFRHSTDEQVEGYFYLLLQEYGVDAKTRARKGNITLENFSATKKVELRIAEIITFDEKLQIAKLKVDEYLEDKTKDADPEIRTLITKAFEVDKEGNIDAKKIFALRSYDIKDARWLEAMDIIDESKKVIARKPYIRFYTRESINDKYEAVTLDIANTK